MPDPFDVSTDALERLVDDGNAEALGSLIEELDPGEAARALDRLDADTQSRVLTTLDPERAALLIDEISDVQAASLIAELEPAHAAAIVTELPSDERADLLNELVHEDREAILGAMPADSAVAIRELASYEPNVAGGLMVTEYAAVDESATLAEIIDVLRDRSVVTFDVQYIYVTSGEGRLVGVLRLRDLLLSSPKRIARDIMVRDPHSVDVRAPLDDLDDFFAHHTFLGVPVVDVAGRLVGVVRRHDVEEAVGERIEDEFRKTQGIVGGEELRSMPVWRRSTRRLSWLSVNIGLNVLAASVIAFYQDTIASVISLAVFLPIISDMSGCSGNQAVAVSMRELSLGLATPRDVARVWTKEVSVGMLNGLVLGVLIGAVAWLWKGMPALGLVVGGALMLNTIVAVSIGGTVPLLLKRLRMDPALASGPILTTVTDMCGFLLVLSFATLMLPTLTR